MKRKALQYYLGIMFAICLIPFAGMLWTKEESSLENRELAQPPKLRTEEGWNVNVLSDAGAYFEDHFAYRSDLVTADAMLRGKLFQVSAADSVIAGTEGWLYYKDSLDDYLGRNVLSDRAVYNIAHTLRLMQTYVEQTGRKFVFTVAPNKNSLYNEHMPYYYGKKVSDERNIEKLKQALESEGVNYVDLFPVFEETDEILYHMRDSHWNNKGAAMAAEELLCQLGMEGNSWLDMEYEVRCDFEGDLDLMLYPDAVTPENEIYFAEPFTYDYVGEVESNFDPQIQTTNADKAGGLLMYRDSFGNALLPFLAEEFGTSTFSRGIPYYLDDMFFSGADTVVVERAERFLPDMSENPPVAQAPLVLLDYSDEQEWMPDDNGQSTCEITDEGLYTRFSGVIDSKEALTDSLIYLRIDGEFAYEAYPMCIEMEEGASDYGYSAYLSSETLEGEEGKVELFLTTEEGLLKVYENILEFPEMIF